MFAGFFLSLLPIEIQACVKSRSYCRACCVACSTKRAAGGFLRPLRGGSETGQNADRFAANRFEAGVVKVTSEFKSSDLSVGLHAVDYYVYRLRRLII